MAELVHYAHMISIITNSCPKNKQFWVVCSSGKGTWIKFSVSSSSTLLWGPELSTGSWQFSQPGCICSLALQILLIC
jgi:hypothetical protein